MSDAVAGSYELRNGWTSLTEILEVKAASPIGLRIDLGCGFSKVEGYVGLDNLIGIRNQTPDDTRGPDVLIDLNHAPFPFPDASCEEIHSYHFLEHSGNLDHVFDESFRVLKPGGLFTFTVPYANSAEGMFPGHSLFLTEVFFHTNANFQAKFAIIREQYDPSEAYLRLPAFARRLLPFGLARQFLFNVCSQMRIDARPRK
jgi:SAM-dependent methyltransferase